jgi:hypothetical protein
MRIAITAQISLRQLADLLDQPAAVPAGLGGTLMLPEVRALSRADTTSPSSRSIRISRATSCCAVIG